MRPGDCVWDVGANIGHYTRLFAGRVGAEGTVFAFEPSPVNYSRLSRACAALSNTKLFQMGIGRQDDTLMLRQGADDLGATSRVFSDMVAGEGIDVEMRSGASLLASGAVAPPNVLKIDVEGFELEVLEGFGDHLRNETLRTVGVEVHFGILSERGLPKALEKSRNCSALWASRRRGRTAAISLPPAVNDEIRNHRPDRCSCIAGGFRHRLPASPACEAVPWPCPASPPCRGSAILTRLPTMATGLRRAIRRIPARSAQRLHGRDRRLGSIPGDRHPAASWQYGLARLPGKLIPKVSLRGRLVGRPRRGQPDRKPQTAWNRLCGHLFCTNRMPRWSKPRSFCAASKANMLADGNGWGG